MRLLNIETLKFQVYPTPSDRPPYAIASHRWIGDEITYQQWIRRDTDGSVRALQGYQKIIKFCNFLRDWMRRRCPAPLRLEWIWIDTCCINKESATELSEAINSMFQWYAQAGVCLAYLHDVPKRSYLSLRPSVIANSAWFQRGWTLQELIAPRLVVFLCPAWCVIGHKGMNTGLLARSSSGRSLENMIASVTNIPVGVLAGYTPLAALSMEVKRTWMQLRTTTRPEDAAYCMLGICGVNLPLIYGEGEESALDRLEEAIERKEARTRLKASTRTNEAARVTFDTEPPSVLQNFAHHELDYGGLSQSTGSPMSWIGGSTGPSPMAGNLAAGSPMSWMGNPTASPAYSDAVMAGTSPYETQHSGGSNARVDIRKCCGFKFASEQEAWQHQEEAHVLARLPESAYPDPETWYLT